jgi:hypothetical protein
MLRTEFLYSNLTTSTHPYFLYSLDEYTIHNILHIQATTSVLLSQIS